MPERDTGSRSGLDRRGPARHELPAVDEAGLIAGRQATDLMECEFLLSFSSAAISPAGIAGLNRKP